MADDAPGLGAGGPGRPVDRVGARLAEALGADGAPRDPLVVAFSGGLDSCVLLHALRFGGPDRVLVAAHFDHGMRDGSERDAAWAAGVCRAWGVDFRSERAERTPRSEAEARSARYAFLHRVATETPGARLLTAHHADDQAETVLFRALRGTGIAGLGGIPARREPRIVRPLLDLWRGELEAYADAVGLRWREDPTNEQLGYARNVLRHSILPEVERRVVPGARASLVRLADLARQNEEAWAETLPRVLVDLDIDGDSADARAVAGLGEALRARVLRHLAARFDVALDESATRRAVAFASESRSGTVAELGGGLELRRELDRLRFAPSSSGIGHRGPHERTLRIEDPGPGAGTLALDGRVITVRWAPDGPGEADDTGSPAPSGAEGDDGATGPRGRACFLLERVRFPLTVRARRPGDRITRPGGTSKVKKVMLESRVPSRERPSVAVVADADETVLWVEGIAVSTSVAAESPAEGTMTMEIE